MSKSELLSDSTTATLELIESQTPAAPSTAQTMETATTVTIASAIDRAKAIFMTDQGSTRTRRSRARRGRPRGLGFVVWRVVGARAGAGSVRGGAVLGGGPRWNLGAL